MDKVDREEINVYSVIKSNGICPGAAVISTAGHDKDRVYLVLDVKEKDAYLSDGRIRRAGNPKKKRVTHIKMLGMAEDPRYIRKIMQEISSEEEKDIEIRKILSNFFKKGNEVKDV